MDRIFKKRRWLPLIILVVSTFLSFVYVVDSAKTNRQIVSSLYQWDINYRKQIDSLKLENDTKDQFIDIVLNVDSMSIK